jgi:S-adenosylmethionine-diacylglycerol 3-amino-3-carboxypropyl transferase
MRQARAGLIETVTPVAAPVAAPVAPVRAASPIHERAVFERLLFAQCWEDPAMDARALRVRPGNTVVSVTSGGCNTLALALQGAAVIHAVDMNAAQSALLELKLAGALTLRHGEYLELLGVRPSPRRQALYARTRSALPAYARAYWDAHGDFLRRGVLRAGRYEVYLGWFRRLLHAIEGRRKIDRLLACRTLEEQQRVYDTEWNTLPWRLFFRTFFSRRVLGAKGLDRAFFTYVEGIPDFGGHFLSLARHALTELPIRDNWFIAQICLGRFLDEEHLPPYLLARNFEALGEAAPRVRVHTEEIGTLLRRLPPDSVDAFNFSNVFEWVPPAVFEHLLRETHRAARPGARLCYRNLLVRRRHPSALDGLFQPEAALAARLLWQDRSFVYSHFEVARVVKPAAATEAPCASSFAGRS